MKRFLAIFICLCLCLSGCATQLSPLESPAAPVATRPPQSEGPNGLPVFITDEHIPYMTGSESGCFVPEGLVTRGDACQMLYTLLENPVEGHCSFADLEPGDTYYDAVACLTAWGVISDSADNFNPHGLLSRAQLVTMLTRFYPIPGEDAAPYVGSFLRRRADIPQPEMLPGLPSFSDISSHWAAAAIENAVARGWVEPGGSFGPNVAVTRAEFCKILNRVLGRQGDAGTAILAEDIPFYSDVPSTHEAFADIMEASQSHDYYHNDNGIECWTGYNLSPGCHRKDGHLFYVDENGELLRGTSLGNLTFDDNGRYTCGVPETDALVAQILQSLGTDTMSDYQALRTAYYYCARNKVYIKHTWASYGCPPEDYSLYQHAYRARKFYESGGGTCYDFAAGFGILARALGYNAYIVYAQINEFYAPHGWVVIPEGGVNYIYDPEMEATRPWRHSGYDLFRITNHSIYHYWYTPWW